MAEPVSSLQAGSQIKAAFGKFSELQVGEGFGELSKLGADVISLSISGLAGYLVYHSLENKNLKKSQKILPVIGYSLGILVTFPLAIAIVAGAAVLVPPLIFAASCVAVMRNTVRYIEERAERNNLRKEMISATDLFKQISKSKLSDETNNLLKDYIKAQDPIYTMLYAARQEIIADGSLPTNAKRAKILELNKVIEDFYLANQGEGVHRTQQLTVVAQRIEAAGLKTVGHKVTEYAELCQKFDGADIPKSLQKSIGLYQFSHEKIYSQDLPSDIKHKCIQLIEGKKIAKDDLKLLYSHLGNQFINQTPVQQLAIQDDNFNNKMKGLIENTATYEQAKTYYQQPRKVYDEMMILRDQLPALLHGQPNRQQAERAFAAFRENFITHPEISDKEWQSFKALLPANIDCSGIESALQELKNQDSLFEKSSVESKVRENITEHRRITIAHFANSYQAEYPAPKFDFDLSANDVLQRAGIKSAVGKAVNTLGKGFNSVSDKVREGVMRKIAQEKSSPEDRLEKEHQHEIAGAKQAIREDFKERYAGVFNIVHKKERLNILEKTVPRRLLNVFLSVGVAATSLATTVIIPAVATPAAPLAAVAVPVIGALSTALTVTSLSNSMNMFYKNFKSHAKLTSTKKTVSSGIVPDIGYEDKMLDAGRNEIAKANKQAAKQERQAETRVRLFDDRASKPNEVHDVSSKVFGHDKPKPIVNYLILSNALEKSSKATVSNLNDTQDKASQKSGNKP